MNIIVKITPNLHDLFKRLGDDLNAGRKAGMINLVAEVEARAVNNAPVVTSNLVNYITSSVNADGSRGVVRATAPYAEFVHEGTGIFGPKKRKIVPTSKKALFWMGAAHPVKSVKGMRPRPFMAMALKGLNVNTLFEEGIMNFLRKRGW